MPPTRRGRPWARAALGALVAVGAVVLAAAAWTTLRALAAEDHLGTARADLRAARSALLEGDVPTAREAVRRAGDSTRRARDLTSDPVWSLASAVPRAGATPATVRGVARAADDVARTVLPTVVEAAARLDPVQLRTPDGGVRLDLVRAAGPPLAQAAETADRVRAELDALPADDAVGPVRTRSDAAAEEFRDLADVLGDAAEAVAVAPALLGEDRPRRYLLLVQQTGEARGTGGIVGGYVVLEASAGRLDRVASGSNADLRNGDVAPPASVDEAFVQLYEPSGGFRYWQNANLSPDLPVVARVFQGRWQAQGGQPLDGVVLLDALALASVLEGTGPLPLQSGEVLPEDLVEYLAVGQYADFAPEDPTAIDQSRRRKDQLEDVAAVVADRLTGGGADTRQLLTGLVGAVRSGHVRMASEDPALGPLLARTGVDGALPAGAAPVAYAVVNNGSGGKLDHFLDRRVSYRAGGCGGERRRSTVEVTLTNGVPGGDLPPYLTVQLTPEGRVSTPDQVVNLAVYGTRGAELVRATVDGAPVAPELPDGPVVGAAEEAGLPRWDVRLVVPQGQSRVLVLELDEPASAGAARVPEQPLSRELVRDVDVPVCR